MDSVICGDTDCDPAPESKTWTVLDSCLDISFPAFGSEELFCSTPVTTLVSLIEFPFTPDTAPLPAPELTLTPATAPLPAPELTLTPATAPLPAPEPTLTPATAPLPAPEPTLTPATAPLPAPEFTLTPATAPLPAPEPTLTPATAPLPAPEPTLTPATAPLPAPEPTLTPATAPPMRDPCGQKCRRKCTDKFNEERRREIWNRYWGMEYTDRRAFMFHSISQLPTTKFCGDGKTSRRSRSFVYRLKNEDQVPQQVCKTFFLTTLGYHPANDSLVFSVMPNGIGNEVIPRDQRGRHTPANKLDMQPCYGLLAVPEVA
ncbi:hypothetical protein QQF64_015196 [Cirrhinus molitorella]|uniref:Uncharacterized protein n=1 Tax=Cirrhinus molitorella TaxID=172907 RepID=A0ABR3NVI2_9TELE